MFSIECNEKNNTKKIIIQGDLDEVKKEVAYTISEVCKTQPLIAEAVLKGVLDSKGKDFILNYLQTQERQTEKKDKVIKITNQKEILTMEKLLHELEKITRGIADE